MEDDVAHNNRTPSNQTATSVAQTTSNHANRYTRLSLSLNCCDHFGTLELNFHGMDSIISSGTSRVSVVITAFCTTRFVFPAFCADRRARTRSRALAPRSVRTVGVVAHYGFRTVCEWFPKCLRLLRQVPERFPGVPYSFRRISDGFRGVSEGVPFCTTRFVFPAFCADRRARTRARALAPRGVRTVGVVAHYGFRTVYEWFPKCLRVFPTSSRKVSGCNPTVSEGFPTVSEEFPKVSEVFARVSEVSLALALRIQMTREPQ